ncbi:MAG: hypothetical protein ACR2OB_03345 [Solirubrobacteraceae bacterium]
MSSGCFKTVGFKRIAAALMVVGALALAGCGSSTAGGANNAGGAPAGSGQTATSTQQIAFAKTKFIFHAALAFGAFHRYIYKPFRRGGFSPASQHKAALAKAGLAALFAYHEAKIALTDAQASPLLSKLVAPLTALQNQLSGLSGRLKAGALDATGISSAASTVDRIGAQSARSYKAIPDAPTPSLGG